MLSGSWCTWQTCTTCACPCVRVPDLCRQIRPRGGNAHLVEELGIDHADLVDEQRVRAAPAIAHLQNGCLGFRVTPHHALLLRRLPTAARSQPHCACRLLVYMDFCRSCAWVSHNFRETLPSAQRKADQTLKNLSSSQPACIVAAGTAARQRGPGPKTLNLKAHLLTLDGGARERVPRLVALADARKGMQRAAANLRVNRHTLVSILAWRGHIITGTACASHVVPGREAAVFFNIAKSTGQSDQC